MVQFASIEGGISRSGVQIRPPEDEPFRPKTMREVRIMGLPQPYSQPRIMPGLEAAAPTPDFSGAPGGDATGAMPPIQLPGERLPRPVYQEPEPPGKLRTAIGIGLSGVAGLSGQSQYASQQFFQAPEARAERDYARELAEYSASQGEWSQYFEDIMGREELGIDRQQLELAERAQTFKEGQPIAVPYRGTLYDPTKEEVMFEDTRAPFGDSQWGQRREDAFNFWLEANPGRTREDMTHAEEEEAIVTMRIRRGLEVGVPGFDEEGMLITRPRSESYYRERPAQRFDALGNIVYQEGTTGTRPRPPVVTERDIARVDEWVADQKRLSQGRYLARKNQLMAPIPGSPGEEAAEAAQQAELDGIDEEGRRRKERLRSGTIAPGPGETRVLQYNVETGRAE